VALAQTPTAPAPEAPPPTWVGGLGAGLSLTSGNSDTLNVNVAFDLTRTPKARNVIELKALYLRGEQNDSLVANRTSVTLRDNYTLSGRTFLYAQVDYLRDTFKLIDYLVAPTVGVGRKIVDTTRTKFSVDAGAGSITEKNPGAATRTNAAVTASEKLTVQLTATSSLKHAASGLWKASDFSDGLYAFSVGLATKISERTQLSLDLLDTFRSKRPTPSTKRNDVAFVASIIAKF
jgi:putative salt-induced outer membrane protein